MAKGMQRAGIKAAEKMRPERFIGLGQASPEDDVIRDIMKMGFTQVPVIEYTTWTVNLPITTAEVSATFGNQINLLSGGDNPPAGVDAQDTSFVINGLLQVDMLVVGFGIHVFGEPESFTQIGNAFAPVPEVAYAPPVSPDVFTANDVANDVLGLAATDTLTPAILEWGLPAWEAAWHLANAYQFQWRYQQRHLLINELVADVCYFGPYAEAEAAGTSEKPVIQFARRINDRYRDKGGTNIFVPVSHRRVGSVTAATGFTGNNGVFHPTRDFDLAPVTWGGIRNQGGAACCSPFRKLIRPVLLDKGIPIGMELVAQNDFHHGEMQRWLGISDLNETGNNNVVAFDGLANNLSAAGAAPELLLDQGANAYANQQVQTNRAKFKGGTMKLAMLIKGFELWGPWKEKLVREGYAFAPGAGMAGGPLASLPGR